MSQGTYFNLRKKNSSTQFKSRTKRINKQTLLKNLSVITAMAFITENWTYDIICITTSLVAVLVAYCKWSLTYWQRKNLETLPPSIMGGNAKNIFLQKASFSEVFYDVYNKFKAKGLKHGGFYFFLQPGYVPIDPEIIKHIMQKDFNCFVNHGAYFNEKDDPLSAHLFSIEDDKWRNLRAKLTPTFTSGRLKAMFQTLVDCSKELTTVIDASSANGKPVDIKDILACFTTDIIGSCAFGIECNSLKNPDAEFRRNGRRFFEVDLMEGIKMFLQFSMPRDFLNKLGFTIVKSDVAKFFMNAVEETVEYREKNNVHRKDFMHLLLQLKNRGQLSEDDKILDESGSNKEIKLTMNELAAQAFVFFLAGFETSSSAMTFALCELALNEDIQQKAREEINRVLAKHNNEITYDALMEMNYLEQIISEALRKYPALGVLFRVCNKDYKVPGTDLVLKKGTRVFIPVSGLHNDPEYYPEPEAFRPERFSEENKRKRHQFTYLPFGEGPRICIGLRFGIMQSKVGLVEILRNYKVSFNKKTVYPIHKEPNSFVTTAKGGVWLNVEKI